MDTTGIYTAGTVIDGRYRIEKRLGRGGFATVYHAHHLQLDRPAALKVLEPVAPHISDRFQARFMTEARIAANLDHPNVVRIFDFGVIEPDDRPYIAMEMLTGRDLEQHLRAEGPLDPQRAKNLFDGVLDALRIGHERGIVHKDLKPSNLFMVNTGEPTERLVILDYGIARLEGDNNPRYTEEGQYTGTPAYMPPEYIQRREVLPAYDVYQIGLIFIEVMTGQPVVRGESNLACMVAHIEGKHHVPDDFGDTPLGASLLKALAIDPTDRYVDAGEMLDAIRIANVDAGTDFTLPAVELTPEEQERISGEHSGPRPNAGGPTQPQQPTHPPQPQHVPPKKKSRGGLWFILGIIGGSVLCVGTLTFALFAAAIAEMDANGEFDDLSTIEEPMETDAIEQGVLAEIEAASAKNAAHNMPKMPGTVPEADALSAWLLARSMAWTTVHLADMFEYAYGVTGGWKKGGDGLAVGDASTFLSSARQQINVAKKTGPRNRLLEQHADNMLRDLEVVTTTLVSINRYSSRKEFKKDGGKEGEALRTKLQKQQKNLEKSLGKYSRTVDDELSEFLKSRAKSYRSTDPFLYRATKGMTASHELLKAAAKDPGSDVVERRLDGLAKSVDSLQIYVTDHQADLSARYSMYPAHQTMVTSLDDTLNSGHELRESVQEGDRVNLQWLRMAFRSDIGAYSQLLRF